MIDTLDINAISECVNCSKYAIQGDWGEFWACSGAVVLGVIARFFEKRRMKRKFRKGK